MRPESVGRIALRLAGKQTTILRQFSHVPESGSTVGRRNVLDNTIQMFTLLIFRETFSPSVEFRQTVGTDRYNTVKFDVKPFIPTPVFSCLLNLTPSPPRLYLPSR
jgi:hypothetical protein